MAELYIFLAELNSRKKEVPPYFDSWLTSPVCIILLQIMTETYKEPTIKIACHQANRLTDLQTLSQGLERCQKSLNDYLDSKRNSFPRFFFISDDELLSILGSSDPNCVQEHMIKVRQRSEFISFYLFLDLIKQRLTLAQYL